MVIVDSTVWVDYFNGLRNPETDWLDVQLDVQRLGLTTIIMCEVETDLSKLEVFGMHSVALGP